MAEASKESMMSKLLRNTPIVGTIMQRNRRTEKAADRTTMLPAEYTKKHGVSPDMDPELKDM